MDTVRRTIVCLAVVVGAALDGSADSLFHAARPATRAWGANTPFSSATVYCPHRDSLGRIWIGTTTGPAYLEGTTMREFPLPPEAGTPTVRAVMETRDGAMWFGTEAAGLWQHKEGRWRRFGRADGLPFDVVNTLLETVLPDGTSVVWVGTRTGGVARLIGQRWEVFDVSDGLPDALIWKLRLVPAEKGEAEVWAATGRGVGVFRDNRWHAVTRTTGLPPGVGSVNDIAIAIDPTGRREVWLSCWGAGLAHGDGTTWTLMGEREGFASRNPTDLAVSAAPDGTPIVWAATYDRGLFWRDQRGWHSLDPARGLAASGVYGLLTTPGTRPDVWVGTRGAGLLSIDLTTWRAVDERDGLPSSEISALASDEDDATAVWIGTPQGLGRWSQSGWERVALPRALRTTLVSALASARTPTGQAALWVGTPNGLAIREGTQWRIPGAADGVPRTRVRALLAVPRPSGGSDVWVGFDTTLAAWRDGRWTIHDAGAGLPAEVVNLAYAAGPSGRHVVWVVTLNGEVWALLGDRWARQAEGLQGRQVTGLEVLSTDQGSAWVWAGTRDGSLCRCNGLEPAGRWMCTPLPDTLVRSARTIRTIVVDRQGRLYGALNQAYLRVPIEEATARPRLDRLEMYSQADGFPAYIQQTHRALAMLDRQGQVWFGTPRGAALIDPSAESPLAPLPRVRFVRVNTDSTELSPATADDLPYRVRRLTFEFAWPFYDRPEQVRYRTQLRGLEDEPGAWQPAVSREITGLGPGSYTLVVTARDHAGRESEPAEFPFRIAAPPWSTWWAYTAYLLLLMGLGYAVVRVRSRTLEREKRTLEQVVAERTEQLRHRNEELAEARDRALEATRAKSDFLANMSHEIRTPMNAILGFSELGLRLDLPLGARDYFRKIAASGHSLLGLVNDVLDFSKIEAGKLELEVVPFDLLTLIGEVADLFSHKTSEKGLALRWCAAADVPCSLIGDPLRLGQILTNLVSNAVKFTTAGHVIVRVDVADREGDLVRLRFAVHDSGIGMSAEERDRLFEAFCQADASTTRKYGGTGLGLTISKCLVEKMEGSIEVASAPRRGSTFTFTVRMRSGNGTSIAGMVAADLRRRTVLVLARSAALREVLADQVRAFGFVAAPAETVAAAIELAQTSTVDLLLVDWNMPGPFGADIARTVAGKAGRPATPAVVAMTAADLEEAGTEGRQTWLPLIGPIHPSLLLNTLAAAFGGSAAGVESERPQARSHHERRVRGLHVLLVEDNVVNREVALALLTGAGVRVDTAGTGVAAVHMVESAAYDAVLMDIQMPEMDGYQATRLIRQQARHDRLPIIAMTAHALGGIRDQCLAAGMNDYLTKPIDAERMFATLADHAGRPAGAADDPLDPAPPPEMPAGRSEAAVPGVDLAVLVDQLRGNSALAMELITVFRSDYRDHARRAAAAVERRDWEQAGRLVHAVKGASGTLAAGRLHRASIALEQGIEDRDMASLPDLLARFAAALDELVGTPAAPPGQPPGDSRGGDDLPRTTASDPDSSSTPPA